MVAPIELGFLSKIIVENLIAIIVLVTRSEEQPLRPTALVEINGINGRHLAVKIVDTPLSIHDKPIIKKCLVVEKVAVSLGVFEADTEEHIASIVSVALDDIDSVIAVGHPMDRFLLRRVASLAAGNLAAKGRNCQAAFVGTQ